MYYKTSPYKKDTSLQHIHKAMLQCDISPSCLTFHLTAVDLNNCDWLVDETEVVHSVWATLPKASLACKELKHCICKRLHVSDRCTCKTPGLLYTD